MSIRHGSLGTVLFLYL